LKAQPCLTIVQNKYSSLTTVEKRIADYVLEHPADVIASSTKVLAERTGVAASAINRFCKTLEYEGFTDFKLSLALELGNQSNDEVLCAVSSGDNVSTVFDKVFQSSIRTLQDTRAMLDEKQLQEIVKILDEANQIVFFGIGTSSTIAIDAHYRFMQLGYRVSVFSDALYMRVAAANVGIGDVAVGISHSGATREVIETMRLAKEQGATTIAITSYQDSPICKFTDQSIVVYSDDQNYPVEAVSARMAHICLLDALMVALSVRHYDEAQDHLRKRNQALREIRR